MEEEVQAEGFWKYKYYFLAGFIVLMLISFLIGFFILRQAEDVDEEDILVFSAIEENNFSLCDSLSSKERIYSCRILVRANQGNESFCNNDFESLSLPFGSPVTQRVEIKAEDYCWIIMGVNKKTNYCENVSSSGKQICLNNMEYWRI